MYIITGKSCFLFMFLLALSFLTMLLYSSLGKRANNVLSISFNRFSSASDTWDSTTLSVRSSTLEGEGRVILVLLINRALMVHKNSETSSKISSFLSRVSVGL